MVLSMTGYGQAKTTFQDKTITVEIKSLNGKMSDVRCKIPSSYKAKELILRKLVLDKAHRGKFDFSISVDSENGDDEYGLNKSLYKRYFSEISMINRELGASNNDIVSAILRIPNVVGAKEGTVSEEEWQVVKDATLEAIGNLNDFRAEEGKVLFKDLSDRNRSISALQEKIEPFEGARVANLKDRIFKNLQELQMVDSIDNNRFEQEIIYYLEKLDINEEKVRLSQHCKYFEEILYNDTALVGKKLGFIAQEMGREINTLGAKAQHKDIQKIVIAMKDELEKIKEQIANII